jgi:hypothetical protein
MEYRFNRSLNVPAILVSESAQAQPGTALRLSLKEESCGEILKASQGDLVYFSGPVELDEGVAAGEWLACKVEETPQRDFHTVLLTRGHVLIEVVAFPEAGVSREDIIRLAGSFAEAQ